VLTKVAYNLRFPGQVFDGQAGLHQNGFRDFDPAVGRYVESDPAGLRLVSAASINTYQVGTKEHGGLTQKSRGRFGVLGARPQCDAW
jgi:RHS repeat-associated protein